MFIVYDVGNISLINSCRTNYAIKNDTNAKKIYFFQFVSTCDVSLSSIYSVFIIFVPPYPCNIISAVYFGALEIPNYFYCVMCIM